MRPRTLRPQAIYHAYCEFQLKWPFFQQKPVLKTRSFQLKWNEVAVSIEFPRKPSWDAESVSLTWPGQRWLWRTRFSHHGRNAHCRRQRRPVYKRHRFEYNAHRFQRKTHHLYTNSIIFALQHKQPVIPARLNARLNARFCAFSRSILSLLDQSCGGEGTAACSQLIPILIWMLQLQSAHNSVGDTSKMQSRA